MVDLEAVALLCSLLPCFAAVDDGSCVVAAQIFPAARPSEEEVNKSLLFSSSPPLWRRSFWFPSVYTIPVNPHLHRRSHGRQRPCQAPRVLSSLKLEFSSCEACEICSKPGLAGAIPTSLGQLAGQQPLALMENSIFMGPVLAKLDVLATLQWPMHDSVPTELGGLRSWALEEDKSSEELQVSPPFGSRCGKAAPSPSTGGGPTVARAAHAPFRANTCASAWGPLFCVAETEA